MIVIIVNWCCNIQCHQTIMQKWSSTYKLTPTQDIQEAITNIYIETQSFDQRGICVHMKPEEMNVLLTNQMESFKVLSSHHYWLPSTLQSTHLTSLVSAGDTIWSWKEVKSNAARQPSNPKRKPTTTKKPSSWWQVRVANATWNLAGKVSVRPAKLGTRVRIIKRCKNFYILT